MYCPNGTCGTSTRSSLRPKPSTLLSLVCSLESSTSVELLHVYIMYCPYSNCESLSEFAQAEAIDATFTGLFAQVIHLHQASSCRTKQIKTIQTGVCSGWSHGSHIHPWDWPIIADLQSTTNPMAGITRLHVTRRTHTHPHQQLIQLFEPCGRLHMDWQSASTGAFSYFLSDWPTVWAGPANSQAFKSHNNYKWPKKFIGTNIQGAVLGPETSTKLWVLKDPAHHFPRNESSTSAFHLHLCNWPHDPRVSCHPCKGNRGQYKFIYIYINAACYTQKCSVVHSEMQSVTHRNAARCTHKCSVLHTEMQRYTQKCSVLHSEM